MYKYNLKGSGVMNAVIDWETILPKLTELRSELHNYPEISGKEIHTRQRLMSFLKEHTQIEVIDHGRWFSAYMKGRIGKQTIALRADHDAIINTKGEVFHGCGHDGHSVILVGVAMILEACPVDDNILMVFQHSEENGVGAKEIMKEIKDYHIDHFYGLHNFPGFKEGQLLLKSGTFMCASMGMDINLTGIQSHAGQPEKGLNPIYLISKLASDLEPLVQFNGFNPTYWGDHMFSDLVMVTIVSTSVGEINNFGISPAHGNIQLTLRAAKIEDMTKLFEMIKQKVMALAKKYQINYQIHCFDEFPDTDNSESEVNRIMEICENQQIDYQMLEEPFRPSEDFGWYLKTFSGCFFGIGAGLTHPPLHHDDYEFPDKILKDAISAFYYIISDPSNKAS